MLFDFDTPEDGWAGSYHVEQGSFLDADRALCYICATIYRDCNNNLRQEAHRIRTYYQLRLLPRDGSSGSEEDRYELDFTGEISDGQERIERQQVFDCRGLFKILPRDGRINCSNLCCIMTTDSQ